jgi:hypothetical protein
MILSRFQRRYLHELVEQPTIPKILFHGMSLSYATSSSFASSTGVQGVEIGRVLEDCIASGFWTSSSFRFFILEGCIASIDLRKA